VPIHCELDQIPRLELETMEPLYAFSTRTHHASQSNRHGAARPGARAHANIAGPRDDGDLLPPARERRVIISESIATYRRERSQAGTPGIHTEGQVRAPAPVVTDAVHSSRGTYIPATRALGPKGRPFANPGCDFHSSVGRGCYWHLPGRGPARFPFLGHGPAEIGNLRARLRACGR